MQMSPIPISDDEILLRLIPRKLEYYDPHRPTALSADAFKPHRANDVDGLSMSRAKNLEHPEFLTPEELATHGPSPHGYFVAELKAGDLRQNGIEIVPDPMAHNPGHVLLPRLNSANRKSDEVEEFMQRLKTLTREVHGPFPTPQA
jgi:hypothetical protein